MSFEINYDKQPVKFLKKLDKNSVKRILDRIDEQLQNNAVPHDAKRIVGEHNVFRLRIGDYRALYRINYPENKIIVFKIDKRDRVY
ncbi:type II toxin-antitoxin system RelE/ParE family toxin [Candidatus Woesearchaeota archaeon]|nr:type II toxin-antitoxin system RelE/ParE family toxin [Candidatus Woesearchaeota archaeon]